MPYNFNPTSMPPMVNLGNAIQGPMQQPNPAAPQAQATSPRFDNGYSNQNYPPISFSPYSNPNMPWNQSNQMQMPGWMSAQSQIRPPMTFNNIYNGYGNMYQYNPTQWNNPWANRGATWPNYSFMQGSPQYSAPLGSQQQNDLISKLQQIWNGGNNS